MTGAGKEQSLGKRWHSLVRLPGVVVPGQFGLPMSSTFRYGLRVCLKKIHIAGTVEMARLVKYLLQMHALGSPAAMHTFTQWDMTVIPPLRGKGRSLELTGQPNQ